MVRCGADVALHACVHALHVAESALVWEKGGRERRTLSPLVAAGYSIAVLQLSAFTRLSRRAIVFHDAWVFLSITANLQILIPRPTERRRAAREFQGRRKLYRSFPRVVKELLIVPMFNSGSGFAEETVESMVGMLGLRRCGNCAT